MSKHHQQTKTHQANRMGGSMSIDPEFPNQTHEEIPGQASSSEEEFVPTYEDIQKKAYQIHKEKGGNDLDNWLEAEALLKEGHRNR